MVAGTTIESAVHNGTIADFTDDANDPRPVIAGGTGAASASLARKNLATEVRNVEVTNYDSHTFEAGSFWSKAGATGAPDNPSGASANKYAGTCVIIDAETVTPANRGIVITARNEDDINVPGRVWVREKRGTAAWSGWHAELETLDLKVSKLGDTMVGNLTIEEAAPALNLQRLNPAQTMSIRGGSSSGGQRWQLDLGNATSETGSNAGTNFVLNRFSDAGAFLGIPLQINRASGTTTLSAGTDIATIIGITMPGGGSNTLYQNGGVTVGSVTTNSSITAFNTSSDMRLKEDLQSFDAGNIVDDTNVYSFKWKSTGERAYGVIAQQANEVYPTAVSHDDKTDWWGIDYSKYVPVILQELKALRARVAELEGRLASKPS